MVLCDILIWKAWQQIQKQLWANNPAIQRNLHWLSTDPTKHFAYPVVVALGSAAKTATSAITDTYPRTESRPSTGSVNELVQMVMATGFHRATEAARGNLPEASVLWSLYGISQLAVTTAPETYACQISICKVIAAQLNVSSTWRDALEAAARQAFQATGMPGVASLTHAQRMALWQKGRHSWQ